MKEIKFHTDMENQILINLSASANAAWSVAKKETHKPRWYPARPADTCYKKSFYSTKQ